MYYAFLYLWYEVYSIHQYKAEPVKNLGCLQYCIAPQGE
jgi:hypothetical protein